MKRAQLAILCLMVLRTAATFADDALHICFVAGRDSHGRGQHKHGAGLEYLKDALLQAMPTIKTSIHKGGWPSDPAFFEGADAVVIYSDGGPRHVVMGHLAEVDKLADAGVGIACLHYAVEVPKGDPGQHMLKWTGGYFETHWSVNPHWTAEFTAYPDHPVTRGMTPFTMNDEWYFHMRFRDNMQGVTPVLSAIPPLSTIQRKDGPHSNNPTVRKEVTDRVPQHLGWVSTRPDGGRGFGFTGGHWHRNWKNDNMRRIVLNGIAWVAGIDIPAGGIATPTPSDEQLNRYLK